MEEAKRATVDRWHVEMDENVRLDLANALNDVSKSKAPKRKRHVTGVSPHDRRVEADKRRPSRQPLVPTG